MLIKWQALAQAFRERRGEGMSYHTIQAWQAKGMPYVQSGRRVNFDTEKCWAWYLKMFHKEERKNPIRHLETNRDWREKNREKARVNGATYASRQKERFFKMYGNKCELCGEADDAVLTLDHVQGDGALERKALGKGPARHWKKAADCYNPDKYRVLCHNCQHREKMRLGLNAQTHAIKKESA